jgi:hypothetical protein
MNLSVFSLFMMLSSVSIVWGDYRIIWSTIDSGGGSSRDGAYVLTGTIGQADTGYYGGGLYEMSGGFWVGGRPLCIVNLEDFAQFASHWLDGPCDAGNYWCGGADLNQQDDVNVQDLTILAGQWLLICPFNWPL